MTRMPAPAPILSYQYEESALCGKISTGWKGPGKKNRALTTLIASIERELARDSSWYDKALIQAGIKTTVWALVEIGGVERAVRANFEAGRLPDPVKLTADLRAALTEIVEKLKKGEA